MPRLWSEYREVYNPQTHPIQHRTLPRLWSEYREVYNPQTHPYPASEMKTLTNA